MYNDHKKADDKKGKLQDKRKEKLAENADPENQYKLACEYITKADLCFCYTKDKKEEKYYKNLYNKKAFYWFNKASQNGNMDASYELIKLYFQGIGVTQDVEKSKELLLMLAKQSYVKAQYDLGMNYLSQALWHREDANVEEKYKKAFYWLYKAIKQGYKEARDIMSDQLYNYLVLEYNPMIIQCKDTNEIAKTYKEYLETKHWKKIRQSAFQKSNGRCWACKAEIQIENFIAHHLTYYSLGNESINDNKQDVVAVCSFCHKKEESDVEDSDILGGCGDNSNERHMKLHKNITMPRNLRKNEKWQRTYKGMHVRSPVDHKYWSKL